ncbi:hypothetical protein N431DRAFT_435335 [Stipitochalara longipes BDJ]|nr:hypothetical protein N431DRAFT_435335 [Stipitochalara longipes BDJ]
MLLSSAKNPYRCSSSLRNAFAIAAPIPIPLPAMITTLPLADSSSPVGYMDG